MEQEMRIRNANKVTPISCPDCGQTMWHEDSNHNLMCENKKCKVGFSYTSSSEDFINIWVRVRKGSKKRGDNLKFIEEAMRRIDRGDHLANNLVTPPRMKTVIDEEDLEEYCEYRGVNLKYFHEIRSCTQEDDEMLASAYDLDLSTIKEIKRLKIRG